MAPPSTSLPLDIRFEENPEGGIFGNVFDVTLHIHTDTHAQVALLAYMQSIYPKRPELALDLLAKLWTVRKQQTPTLVPNCPKCGKLWLRIGYKPDTNETVALYLHFDAVCEVEVQE